MIYKLVCNERGSVFSSRFRLKFFSFNINESLTDIIQHVSQKSWNIKDLLMILVQSVNNLQSTLHEHLYIFSSNSPMPDMPPRRPWQEPHVKLLLWPLECCQNGIFWVGSWSLRTKRSQSGLSDGCSSIAMLCFTRNLQLYRNLRLGALSWCSKQLATVSFHVHMTLFVEFYAELYGPTLFKNISHHDMVSKSLNQWS